MDCKILYLERIIKHCLQWYENFFQTRELLFYVKLWLNFLSLFLIVEDERTTIVMKITRQLEL